MYINYENIPNIAISTIEKPVDFARFAQFIKKSPFVRRIAFIGPAIFDMPRFHEMVKMCAVNNIMLIFGEMGKITAEKARALVEYQNVLFVNVHENDENTKIIKSLKQKMNTNLPEINTIIKTPRKFPQDEISNTSYAFYNLADDLENIPCLNLIMEPMLSYDGFLLGCWQNPDEKHHINAFDLGIERALNHPAYKRIIHMLKTHKINMKSPCARCPVFASMIWSDKKLDICKKLFVS